jgi:hypothetical protein
MTDVSQQIWMPIPRCEADDAVILSGDHRGVDHEPS